LPTIFTHSVVGLGIGKVFSIDKLPKRFWILSFICPSLPDLDYFGMTLLGIPYLHILGHRGATHSFAFAAILGAVIVLTFFRNNDMRPRLRLILIVYFSLIISSHGLLDGLTNGGTA
jgi:inner membrane protein